MIQDYKEGSRSQVCQGGASVLWFTAGSNFQYCLQCIEEAEARIIEGVP